MPSRRLSALALSLALLLVTATPAAADARDWVRRLNRWRGEYGAAAVTADRALSRALDRHVAYMLATGRATHEQDPRHPAYSEAGAAAARRSILQLSWSPKPPMRPHREVDRWLAAPFHALAMLSPRLRATGFAVDRKQTLVASGLDVRARRASGPRVAKPVRVWPSPRTTWVPALAYRGTETPDPLAFCPASFREPAEDRAPLVGLPLVLSLGQHGTAPAEASVTLTTSGQRLGVCLISERSRQLARGSSPQLGELARAILADEHSLVVVPRRPLRRSQEYRVSVTLPGRSMTWRFRTGSERPAPALWARRPSGEAGGPVMLTAFLDDADLSRRPPLLLERQRPGQPWRPVAVRRMSRRGQLTFRVSPSATTRFRVVTVEDRPRRSRALTVRGRGLPGPRCCRPEFAGTRITR